MEAFLNPTVVTKPTSSISERVKKIVPDVLSIVTTVDPTCTSNNISTPHLVSPPATNRIQTTTRCRTNSGARHLLNETEFTNKLYSKFNEGNLPHPPVEKERNFIDA